MIKYFTSNRLVSTAGPPANPSPMFRSLGSSFLASSAGSEHDVVDASLEPEVVEVVQNKRKRSYKDRTHFQQ